MISVSSLVILRCNDSFLEVKHPLSIRPQASPPFKQEEAVMYLQGSSRTPEPLQPKAPQLIWVLLQEQAGWTKAGPISRVTSSPMAAQSHPAPCGMSSSVPSLTCCLRATPVHCFLHQPSRDFFYTSAAQRGDLQVMDWPWPTRFCAGTV